MDARWVALDEVEKWETDASVMRAIRRLRHAWRVRGLKHVAALRLRVTARRFARCWVGCSLAPGRWRSPAALGSTLYG